MGVSCESVSDMYQRLGVTWYDRLPLFIREKIQRIRTVSVRLSKSKELSQKRQSVDGE